MSAPLGCLILHGFTSSLDTVRALVPMVERLELPYRLPILRGHCTRPEDLCGVTWGDWYEDAAAAMHDLRTEADQIVVCGLSMGGLVALHLAAEHPHDIAGVVTIAAALQIADPLIHFSPILARLVKMWKANPGNGYADASLVASNTNYTRIATDALVSLHRYGKVVTNILPRVETPLLLIHSRRDRVIKPASAEIIHQRVSSRNKRIRWFDVSGHEMLQDCEADAVVAEVEQFIRTLQVTNRSVLA
ncbi:MAG TPA: alpha/beta fold hydrolase [Herpetosiphonaceae bacterium]